MLKVNQVRLEFADRVIFNDIDFFIGKDDKVGLVGKNGAGKSTLLKTILGMQSINGGQIVKPKDFTMGYLPQDLDFESSLAVKAEVQTAFEVTKNLESRMEEISGLLTTREDYETQSYLDLIEELNHVSVQLGMYDLEHQEEQIERILLGLGFSREDFDKPMSSLSGGWKMRVALAKILLRRPDLVLLDEPTNHLDIDSVEWLETYLKDYDGAVLLISHDRVFLDAVTNRTIEIINGKAFDYPAAYTRFMELRADVIQKQVDARKNQEREIKQTEALINKFRAKSSKAAFAQSLIKKLDKMDIVEVDETETTGLQFRFPPAPRSGKIVVEALQLNKSFGEKHVLKSIDFEVVRGQKVALVGKNGVGKTTLTKIVAGLSTYSGQCEIGTQVDIGYYSQNQSDELPPRKTALEIIDDEATGEYRTRVRSLLGAFMFQGDDVYKQVSVLSGGEKARLALCKLLLHKYNFIILDEPTNHLDMRSKDVLKEALIQYDGTLLVVSHDRDFLRGLTDTVMEIKHGHMSVFPGDISEFLEIKKAESIREFERNKPKPDVKSAEVANKSQVSEKEKWQLSKRVSTLESEIEKLEKQIKQEKAKGAEFDFNDHQKVKKHMEMVGQLESKLLKKIEEWEKTLEAHSEIQG